MEEVAACLGENLDPNSFHADAEALEGAAARLDGRIDELKAQIFDIVRVQRREFVGAYARASQLAKAVGGLEADLRAVAAEAAGERGGFETERVRADARAAALRAQLDRSAELVDALGAISRAHGALALVDDALAAGRYEAAVGALVEAEADVRRLRLRLATAEPPPDAEQPSLLRGLAASLQGARARLEVALAELFEAALAVDEAALGIRGTLSAGTAGAPVRVSLHEVLAAMAGLGSLERALVELAGRLAARVAAIAQGECVVVVVAAEAGAEGYGDGADAGCGRTELRFEPRLPTERADADAADAEGAEGADAGAAGGADCGAERELACARARVDGILALLRALGGARALRSPAAAAAAAEGWRAAAAVEKSGRAAAADGSGSRAPSPERVRALDPLAVLARELWPAVAEAARALVTDAAVRAAAARAAPWGGGARTRAEARVQLPPLPSATAELRALLEGLGADAAALGLAPRADCLRAAAAALPGAAAGEWRARVLDSVRQLAARAGLEPVDAGAGPADGTPVAAPDGQGGPPVEPWSAQARPLACARCQVSASAPQLLAAVHGLLAAAAADGAAEPGASALLLETARDALDLWRALAPAALARGGRLDGVPGAAALVVSDAAWLAHGAATLCAQYGARLPADLRAHAPLLASVLALRAAADCLLREQVSAQAALAADALAPALAWVRGGGEGEGGKGEGADDEARAAEADASVRRLDHQLGRLAAVWLPTLADGAAGRALGAVAERPWAELARAALDAARAGELRAPHRRGDVAQLLRAALDGAAELEADARARGAGAAAGALGGSRARARLRAAHAALAPCAELGAAGDADALTADERAALGGRVE